MSLQDELDAMVQEDMDFLGIVKCKGCGIVSHKEGNCPKCGIER